MSLRMSARVEARGFDLAFEVADGETVAVLGPNGAGKSTLLAVMSGLLRPDGGHGELDGRTLFGGASRGDSRGAWVPPHSRGISLLAQEPLLFPHLSVLENVAFGPRSRGAGRAAARAEAHRWLAEVDAAELSGRRPAQLSGGQAQRVAIARALAAHPKLLLLDEPMAALDIAVAPAIRRTLRRVLAERTAVIVTHEVLDALVLADRVVILADGRIIEQGPTRDVLERPRTAFTAGLSGLNLIQGTSTTGGLAAGDGLVLSASADPALAAGEDAVAVFSPAAVAVFCEYPHGSPRNVIRDTITDLEPRGAQVRVRSARVSADITPAAVADLDLVPGMDVYFTVKSAEVTVYPR